MARQTTTFHPNAIEALYFQYGKPKEVDYIKCVGTISGNTKNKTLRKKCGRAEMEMTVPTGMTFDISAKFNLETVRSIFGLTKEGLKAGIYAYGDKSIPKKMTVVARISDTFEGKEKIVAIPIARNNSGFSFSVDNENEDVANMNVTLDAEADDNRQYYYEALITESGGADSISEADAKAWEAEFTKTLVDQG